MRINRLAGKKDLTQQLSSSLVRVSQRRHDNARKWTMTPAPRSVGHSTVSFERYRYHGAAYKSRSIYA